MRKEELGSILALFPLPAMARSAAHKVFSYFLTFLHALAGESF